MFAWRYAPRLAAWLTPLVVLLCFGAVYDGYHYASDVIAGVVVGIVVAAVMMKSKFESL
jgi:membrane-associated phospholipid phosphatase